jgi:S-DNA-T family DNA segregation ATPase FtsK/SpoIIIE
VEALDSDQFAAATADVEVRRLAQRLKGLAESGLPGWLGQPLDSSLAGGPLEQDAATAGPLWLKIGEARPLPDCGFWTWCRASVPGL